MKIWYDQRDLRFPRWKKNGNGGSAKLVETIPGTQNPDSNHNVDHFEVWEQKGKHFLFCAEIGPTEFGSEIPADRVSELGNMSTGTLKRIAWDGM